MRATLFVARALLLVLGWSAAWAGSPREPVTDRALREAAIQAVFAGMKVSWEAGRSIEDVWPKRAVDRGPITYPDAMAGEAVYRVTGPLANQAETCAAGNLVTGRLSDVREVRARMFRWPGRAETELLAVVQYDFRGASPAGFCWSLGLLVHLVRKDRVWHRQERYLLETQHHSSIERAELLDLDDSGLPMLVVESGVGGAMTAASTLQVFRLGDGRFEELLNTYSRMESGVEAGYTQDLDQAATKSEKGDGFRLVKRTYWENGRRWAQPRLSERFCRYGFGVNPRDVVFRQGLLRPLK